MRNYKTARIDIELDKALEDAKLTFDLPSKTAASKRMALIYWDFKSNGGRKNKPEFLFDWSLKKIKL